MFEFVNVDLKVPEVEPVNQDGVRFYPIPGADKYYPSVTSITSFKNAQFFAQWRRRIGEQEANRITARAYTERHCLSLNRRRLFQRRTKFRQILGKQSIIC